MRRARLRPDRRISTLTHAELEKLYMNIPAVLKDAIDEMGSSRAGHMLAWRKKGEISPECGGEVVAVKRKASHYYWCPSYQK